MTSVAVVIACHSEERWDLLLGAIASARAQQPAEVIVVVDHNPALRDRLRTAAAGVTVLANRYTRGVSGTRNTGAEHAATDLVAFLDDDIVAAPGWLQRLIVVFGDPAVVGAGSAIRPNWLRARPRWFPDEFLWAVGGSYPGLPTSTAPVRNVWSAGMVVRRDAFRAAGGFRTEFGKVGDRMKPEDTELCLRMAAAGGRWMFVPEAVIQHAVPAGRDDLRHFVRRCWQEGRGKVAMSALKSGEGLTSERDYARRVLPRAVAREMAAAARGRGADHLRRAGAILFGAGLAGLGAATELVASRRH
ncbi:glycosyltransferase family 2 protein [Actinoplanes aureus]|uniref:Glycosyltransferase n=1 Tax=Actinoplanes aureus TaxID=2792083 RepID=A0A931CB98_9ACTN|nr:glycosyltransferase [Actinoplanes aureus]MBG0564216.1 glycosyltransferase [Actinoplanes aureus]